MSLQADMVDISDTRGCHCLAARRRARAITRLYEEQLRPFGLKATQFSVLAALAQVKSNTVGALAEFLGVERTTLTRSTQLLEGHGWISSAKTDDGRERLLRLTPSGRERLQLALPAWGQVQRRLNETPELVDRPTQVLTELSNSTVGTSSAATTA